jgi:hypothetical protein
LSNVASGASAQERGDREDGEAGAEDQPAPEPVGERTGVSTSAASVNA